MILTVLHSFPGEPPVRQDFALFPFVAPPALAPLDLSLHYPALQVLSVFRFLLPASQILLVFPLLLPVSQVLGVFPLLPPASQALPVLLSPLPVPALLVFLPLSAAPPEPYPTPVLLL